MRSGRWRNHGAAWRLQLAAKGQTRHPGAAPSGNALLGKGVPGLGQTIAVGTRRKIDKGGGLTLGAAPTARPRTAPARPVARPRLTPSLEKRGSRGAANPPLRQPICLPAVKD